MATSGVAKKKAGKKKAAAAYTATITIKKNGRISDGDCRKTLKKANGDKASWDNHGTADVFIYFPAAPTPPYNGSPVTTNNFRVAAGASAGPYPIAGGTGLNVTYKYQVRTAANPGGNVLDDPDILVQ